MPRENKAAPKGEAAEATPPQAPETAGEQTISPPAPPSAAPETQIGVQTSVPPERARESRLQALQRLSGEASREGDRQAHSALESVYISLAGSRQMIREAKRCARDEALELLRDLERLLD